MVNTDPSLASLAARPPTPPKENIGPRAEMVPDSVQLSHPALRLLLNTPQESPSSSAEYFGGSSEKINKRVDFSPWTEYHKHPSNIGFGGGSNDQIRLLPPSRDCKSSKSILKPKPDIGSFIPMEDLMNLSVDGNISTMLEATVRHLESSIRNSRLDAYSTLLGCLSAYDDVPEQHDLASRLCDLVRFIRRDIWAKMEDTGALDTQLATQALKLLLYFVTTPCLSDSLPDDFCALVLEESILTLENQAMPKIMVTHYMQLLIQENFASQHLNSNRVNRILVALGRVTTNIKGNRIVGQRLMVYRRLLLHSKAAMVVHVESWVDHLISGMLSTFKEIRGRAVFFGNEASLSLGTTKSVSQTFADTLNRESPDGRKVADFLAARLTAMASVTDDGFWVPQIWSIVILFLRGRRHQLEGWEHLKPWLLIIQKCFNSSDAQIKYQSNRAWTRLIFAVSLDSSTSPKMIKMLRQPILPQLERKHGLKGSQTAKSPKQGARSSYCTLLYYAFRPSATHAQLDHYWEEYVRQMFPKNQSRSKDDVNYFCQVLAGLLCSIEPKAWDENRANINRPVRIDELPCLDPKWVRLRAADILKVFEDLFHDADWKSGKDAEAPIILAWRSFTHAIKQASSKEVKTSMETMTALAHILNTIKRFWQQGFAQRSSHGVSPVIERFDCLIHEAVFQFGIIPFNEKRLAHTARNSYEAAETPSSRGDQHQGPLISPVFVLLELLIRSIGYPEIGPSCRDAVKHLIDVATRSATSRHTQLAILRDLASLTAAEHDADGETRLLVWRLVADAATRAFNLAKFCDLHLDSPQYLGHEYRDAAKILESAILLRPQKAMKEWHDLGTIIAQVLRQEVSSDAVILIITEPIAKAIISLPTSECNDFLLGAGEFLLKNVQWPQSRTAIDLARKSLWGWSHMNSKAAVVDSFDHLYTMTNLLLKTSYSSFELDLSSKVGSFLSEVAVVVATCPVSIAPTLLKSIQQGVAVWIQDPNGVLTVSVASKDPADVYAAVTNLWAVTSNAIESLPKIDSGLLSIIETLIASSLRSRHKAFLNKSILLWNRTFGSVDGLEYPNALRPVLLRLRTLTDLELPNFTMDDDTEEMSSPIIFLNSQPDDDIQAPQFSAPFEPASYIRYNGKPSPGRSQPATSNLKRSPWSSAKDEGLKTTPKARLRHDDSQIQFAAIDSSPLQPDEVESQMLTDRQKEVRQRQTLEATTMFPNLGLVPKSTAHVSNEAMPRLHFAENGISNSPIHSGDEAPSFPAFEFLDDVIGSSPTPRSRIGRFRSRPVVRRSPSLSPVVQVGSSFDISMPCGSDAPTEPQAETVDKEEDADISDQEMPMSNNDNFPLLSKHVGEILDLSEGSMDQPCTLTRKLVSVKESVEEAVDAPSLSDNEVFVGARPESPQLSKDIAHNQVSDILPVSVTPPQALRPFNEAIMGGTIQEPVAPMMHRETPEMSQDPDVLGQTSRTSQIIDSFQDAEAPHTPNEDDQIAAQLVNDLERASSQAESEIRGNLPQTASTRVHTKKRKSAPGGCEAEWKNKRARTPQVRKPQHFQIVVDSRQGDKAGDEYVDIGAGFSPASSPDARLKIIRLPAKGAKGTPKRTVIPRDGTGRDARSSSASTLSDCDSCGTSDETRLSAIDVKRERADHLPVAGRRRRSARLNRLPASSQALHGSDEAPMSSDEFSADILEDVSAKVEQTREHIHLTQWQHTGDAGQGLHGIVSSSRDIHTGSARSSQEIPVGVTGFDDLLEEGNEVGAQRILRSFRKLLENIKRVTLGAEEEREIVSVLVDSVREVHEAGRRHGKAAP